jgi:putative ABC transport system permease protein
MISDYLSFVLKYIGQRRLRSWLTVIGIFIGIAAVISLISISQGMQEAISGQFQMLGTDKIIIMPGGGGGFGSMSGSSTGKLTDSDLDLIGKVRGVEDTAGMTYKQAKVSAGNEVKYTFVIGLPAKADWVIGNLEINGRVFKEGDRYKAVVGDTLVQGGFFKKEIKSGSSIEIENQAFKVVGSVQKIGNRQDDSQIYIPFDTARDLFNEPDEIGMIYAKVQEGFDPTTVADRIESEMRDDRDLKKGEEDFSVQTAAQLADTMKNILGIIQTILVGIAGISLLVGGVGIMNTMYTSVLERTRDIGIMKAIGARNSDVLTIFLIESGLFGLTGGVIGCILGLGIAKGVEIYANYAGYSMLKASINPWLVLLGLGLAFGIGCLSGVLPAIQASKLKPADALRYE